MDEDVEMAATSEETTAEASSSDKKPTEVMRKVYLPNKPLEDGEELVCDPSAYKMLHTFETSSPCLSFDILKDSLGDNRDQFPRTAYIVAGTQSDQSSKNKVFVIKLSNLHETQHDKPDDDSNSSDSENDDDDDEEEEEGAKDGKMNFSFVNHMGCVNRIRSVSHGENTYAAVWSEKGVVEIYNLQKLMNAVEKPAAPKDGHRKDLNAFFKFNGHQSEGFAMDWSTQTIGQLATGDCVKNIHIWKPRESSWHVDQRPLNAHKKSVEDLQWSPTEKEVLASCSVDKSIRIWDTRKFGADANVITVANAHKSDINVISWNKKEPFIVSGGDDGFVHVWDLRNLKTGGAIATFKHHKEPITTVEWHPTEESIFACGGADDQITIWDLSVEQDAEQIENDELKDIPAQLMFIHQGQKDIKELHWHPQIPGTILSTANTGFNIFHTINL